MPKIFLIFWPRCSLERSYYPLCWIQNQGFTQIFTRNTRKLANDSRKTLGHPWYELMTTSDNQIGSDWIRMRMTWGWLRNIAINSRYFSSLFINKTGLILQIKKQDNPLALQKYILQNCLDRFRMFKWKYEVEIRFFVKKTPKWC